MQDDTGNGDDGGVREGGERAREWEGVFCGETTEAKALDVLPYSKVKKGEGVP